MPARACMCPGVRAFARVRAVRVRACVRVWDNRVATILENLEKYLFFGNLRENLENSGGGDIFSLSGKTQGNLRENFFA